MKAISSMATRHVLADLAAAVEAAGLPRMEIESLGGVDAAQRVAAGEQFDLVFLAVGALRKLADAGRVEADSVTPLLLSQVAAAVPADAAAPGSGAPAEHAGGLAFPDAVHMRAALQQATRIGYSTGPSGLALGAMIEDWGLGDELRSRLVQAKPGIPVARLLAEREVDLGFQQLSELVGQPGIRILGVLPPECAIDTVFAGGVAATSTTPDGAREILEFLASDAAAPLASAHSFAPLGR